MKSASQGLWVLFLPRLALSSLALAAMILLSNCAGPPPRLRHLVFDAIVPARQNDHPQSQMGHRAIGEAMENGDYEEIGIFPVDCFPFRKEKTIDPEANLYVILQIDGGGIMGITPASLLAKLEGSLKSRKDFEGDFRDIVSVCSGSSTGAIIAGAVAAGVPADTISNLYTEVGFDLYQGPGRLKRPKPFQFKLNREPFQEAIYNALETDSARRDPCITLKDMYSGPLLVIAAFDLVSGRTLFLRTRDATGKKIEDSENLQLVDAISASAYSGAYVFGKIPCPTFVSSHIQPDGQLLCVKGAVFTDGGQGTQNSTLTFSALEALAIIRSDPKAQVLLISMGAGNNFVDEYGYSKKDQRRHARGLPVEPKQQQARFDKVASYKQLEEILATGVSIKNQARGESEPLQILAVNSIENTFKNPAGYSRLLVYRFDFELNDSCGFPIDRELTPFHITEKGREFLLEQAEKISQWESFRQLGHLFSDPAVDFSIYRP